LINFQRRITYKFLPASAETDGNKSKLSILQYVPEAVEREGRLPLDWIGSDSVGLLEEIK
jgi:hypothetical protein